MPFVSTPNAGQSLGDTRDQMRENTDLLKQSLAINHVDLDLANTGKHNFVQMPTRNGVIPPGLLNGEGTLYTSGTGPQLFYTPSATGDFYQLTATSSANYGTFGVANTGWTFLPGGLIMQYGFVNSTSSGTVNFPRSFPSSCFNVWGQPYYGASTPNGNATVGIKNTGTGITTTTFTWKFFTNSSDYTGFFWWAIGI